MSNIEQSVFSFVKIFEKGLQYEHMCDIIQKANKCLKMIKCVLIPKYMKGIQHYAPF